ncbi:5-formyltetrahydrofolate cyclo-ligase [Lysobacter dokdonensis DS-58]|uniref:5-formyltetrahydrofolate cyclo-ligase n=1 Tax=Lysobacter dokdonensis DS-58 TaxID=1300345 RepID=A0A0A2WN08_9GAMM|nr:5-formyltetrahydrofolate cyclo-ligase [Lysobacter dokdonensis]KGQ20117.1 5-formyltetrahydrofolate cyclo-ligase [Lysobacter dokdonensis DS-58]
MTFSRDTLRRELRARRRAIPAPARIAAADALAHRLLSLPFAPVSGHVAGYWAMDGEIALSSWQLRLPRGCTYCLPVLHEDGLLRFAPWRGGAALVSNKHGIPEPDVPPASLLPAEAMAFVVAPLVAFDARGHRLGMGGGWYDRTFAFRRDHGAPPHLVGAAFAAQQVDTVSPQPWDMPLDALCSESDTHLFETVPAR